MAKIPQWDTSNPANAEDGGSVLAMPAQSKNKAAAWKFIEYATHGDGAQVFVDNGNSLPALKKILNSSAFKDKKFDYFGGQKVNSLISEIAQEPTGSYQFLPFSSYAQSIFGDYVGKAYSGSGTSLTDALAQYQKALTDYATQQGYTVK
jgi:multiple sugar transport system substrate-binding protein